MTRGSCFVLAPVGMMVLVEGVLPQYLLLLPLPPPLLCLPLLPPPLLLLLLFLHRPFLFPSLLGYLLLYLRGLQY